MGSYTTKDPKDTYLSLLTLGDENADVLPVTVPTIQVQDAAGNLSLLGLSQDAVEFIGILTATVASGLILETGIDFQADDVRTGSITNKDDTDISIQFTSGDPEGSLVASPGSVALRDDGGAGTTLYVKEVGTSDTGWAAVSSPTTTFIDLTDTPIAYVGNRWLKVNAGGNAVEFVAAPAATFLQLTDTPAAYDNGKWLKSTAAGIVFEALPSTSFLDLSDMDEPNYTSDAGALLAVNAAENGVEFVGASATHGDLLFFDGTKWASLAPDTAGKVLITQGVGADPIWDVASAGGSNDPDAIHVDVSGEINGLTAKASPSAGDVVVIEDAAASWAKKKVAMSNLIGNDATAIHTNLTSEISGLSEKATPVNDDLFLIEDSAAGNAKKKVKFSSIGGSGGGLEIPHYSKGSGDFSFAAAYNFVFPILQSQTSIKVSALDIIKTLQGGEASPTYTFYVDDNESFTNTTGSSDPIDEYVTLDSGNEGVNILFVKVSDGTTTTYRAEITVTVQVEPI